MNYYCNLTIYFCLYSVLALSLNVVTGYGGLVNLTHAAFFGLGAYGTALAMTKLHWPFLPSLVISILFAMLFSLTVSIPSWRFKKDLFVIATLAVQFVTFSIMYNIVSLTNGPYGLSGIPRPSVFFVDFSSVERFAFLTVLLTFLTSLLLWWILKSPWGRLLQAMRDDELAARSLGKNTRIVKVQALSIACGAAALAGGLYATYVGYIDPTSFSLDESMFMFSMVLIGGTGNIRGPVVGAITVIAIREALRYVEISGYGASNVRLMAYGALLILIAHKRPQGLAGKYRFE